MNGGLIDDFVSQPKQLIIVYQAKIRLSVKFLTRILRKGGNTRIFW